MKQLLPNQSGQSLAVQRGMREFLERISRLDGIIQDLRTQFNIQPPAKPKTPPRQIDPGMVSSMSSDELTTEMAYSESEAGRLAWHVATYETIVKHLKEKEKVLISWLKFQNAPAPDLNSEILEVREELLQAEAKLTYLEAARTAQSRTYSMLSRALGRIDSQSRKATRTSRARDQQEVIHETFTHDRPGRHR